MKTVLKFSLMLIACVLLGSCDDYPRVHPCHGNDCNKDYKRLTIHAEVTNAEIPVVVAEGIEMDLCGAASTCNLSDQACFSMTALIRNLDTTGKFEIQEGEIELSAENTKCNLTGSFSGNGSKIGNNFEIAATINVSCGTGSFKADDGQLQMTIHGTFPDENVETMNYVMDIDGYLERKV